MPGQLLTIGHSNHPFETFAGLLLQNGITAVADVRSTPHSSYNPQFNREPLAARLSDAGIAYVFLGEELGARRLEPECYRGDQVDFLLTSRSALFARGLKRVSEGLKQFDIALMCAEKDPLECHRTGLVCRRGASHLGRPGHIRPDGSIETCDDLETRLLDLAGQPRTDLFRSLEDRLDEAYAWLERRIAYRKPAGKRL
ncbi:hypothetical protein Pan44_42000 [Caulifigura coniformis]|uniref:DUF488 domain-containing protein n=1 Tax=Caulifigura coniformis TaxID=2527983 RepID=A0A517SJ58_9PLAN|nr:DUF488 domain-containing protein [Caulifigura coniformis]QDT56149.1 hypothetical protein Pan44_42000 [Caulifigura coniformis]